MPPEITLMLCLHHSLREAVTLVAGDTKHLPQSRPALAGSSCPRVQGGNTACEEFLKGWKQSSEHHELGL